MPKTLLSALLSLALAALATADTLNLDGRKFWSTGVTVDGEVKELVPGTKVILNFDKNGGMGASAGCNSMGIDTYTIDEGILILDDGGFYMTEMGCDKGRREQDDFIAKFLSSKPNVVIEGNKLVLSTDSVTIEFLDTVVANPDRPLIGTEWLENGFFTDVIACKMNVEKPGWIKFSDDGKVSFFDGCVEGELLYNIPSSDGVIEFEVPEGGHVTSCPDSGSDNVEDYVTQFSKIFAASVSYDIRENGLDISNENGHGVSFKASDAAQHSTTTVNPGPFSGEHPTSHSDGMMVDESGEHSTATPNAANPDNDVKGDDPESSARSNALTVAAKSLSIVALIFIL